MTYSLTLISEEYEINEALALLKEFATAKFAESVDVAALRLQLVGLDFCS